MILLAVVGGLLLLGDGNDDPKDEAATLPNTTTDANASASTDPDSETDDTSTGAAPTADDLEEFASSYVSTAADDPDAGFALLTPDYQARSPEYADFWGSVSNPEILNVKADPEETDGHLHVQVRLRGLGQPDRTRHPVPRAGRRPAADRRRRR